MGFKFDLSIFPMLSTKFAKCQSEYSDACYRGSNWRKWLGCEEDVCAVCIHLELHISYIIQEYKINDDPTYSCNVILGTNWLTWTQYWHSRLLFPPHSVRFFHVFCSFFCGPGQNPCKLCIFSYKFVFFVVVSIST